jgi:hypothetical protein
MNTAKSRAEIRRVFYGSSVSGLRSLHEILLETLGTIVSDPARAIVLRCQLL